MFGHKTRAAGNPVALVLSIAVVSYFYHSPIKFSTI